MSSSSSSSTFTSPEIETGWNTDEDEWTEGLAGLGHESEHPSNQNHSHSKSSSIPSANFTDLPRPVIYSIFKLLNSLGLIALSKTNRQYQQVVQTFLSTVILHNQQPLPFFFSRIKRITSKKETTDAELSELKNAILSVSFKSNVPLSPHLNSLTFREKFLAHSFQGVIDQANTTAINVFCEAGLTMLEELEEERDKDQNANSALTLTVLQSCQKMSPANKEVIANFLKTGSWGERNNKGNTFLHEYILHLQRDQSDDPLFRLMQDSATFQFSNGHNGLAKFINFPNKQGQTSLMIAAKQGWTSIAQQLLSMGANALYPNKAGLTAFDLTRDPIIGALIKSSTEPDCPQVSARRSNAESKLSSSEMPDHPADAKSNLPIVKRNVFDRPKKTISARMGTTLKELSQNVHVAFETLNYSAPLLALISIEIWLAAMLAYYNLFKRTQMAGMSPEKKLTQQEIFNNLSNLRDFINSNSYSDNKMVIRNVCSSLSHLKNSALAKYHFPGGILKQINSVVEALEGRFKVDSKVSLAVSRGRSL